MPNNINEKLSQLKNSAALFSRVIEFKEMVDMQGQTATIQAKQQKSQGFQKSTTQVQHKKELYALEIVEQSLEWESIVNVGAGLNNGGNTCFMNSVLQVLTHTPPLVYFAHHNTHAAQCLSIGFCSLCQMINHVKNALEKKQSLYPAQFIKSIRLIAPMMKPGRQEDAHEFLRFLLDSLQKQFLSVFPKTLPPTQQKTNFIQQIFGGYLQSAIHCLGCQSVSKISEPFLDLSLDVRKSDNLLKALEHFIRPEILSGRNAYKCEKCKNKCQAKKWYKIETSPPVLTLHLKRFEFGQKGQMKINRHIEFPAQLNLSPFCVSDNPKYELYGVIVHSGYSSHSGHYYSYVKASNGIWYCMDDSQVYQVKLQTVLQEKAYVLMYKKIVEKSFISKKTDLKQKSEVQSEISHAFKNSEITIPEKEKKQNIPKILSLPDNFIFGKKSVGKIKEEKLESQTVLKKNDEQKQHETPDYEKKIPVKKLNSTPVQVVSWDEKNPQIFNHKRPVDPELEALLTPQTPIKKQKIDRYDVEYDFGKQRKKKKNGTSRWQVVDLQKQRGNPFQKYYQTALK